MLRYIDDIIEDYPRTDYHPVFDTKLDFFVNVHKPDIIAQISLYDYLEYVRYSLVLDPRPDYYNIDNKPNFPSIMNIYGMHKYNDKDKYDELKVKYPAVCINAIFNGRKALNYLIKPTNMMYLDLDGFNTKEEAIEKRKEYTSKYDWIIASSLSISRLGLHFIILIDDIHNNDEFNNKYDYVSNTYFDGKLDKNGKSLSRFVIIPYDNNIYINYNPTVLKLNEEKIDKQLNNCEKGAFSITKEEEDIMTTECTFLDPNNTPYNHMGIVRLEFIETIPEDEFDDIDKPLYFYEGIQVMEFNRYSLKNGKVKDGSRHAFIGSATVKMIFINGENRDDKSDELRKSIRGYIGYINKEYCNPPMTQKEVDNSFNYNWQRYISGKIKYDNLFTLKRAFWSKRTKLKGNDKRKVTRRIRAVYQKDESHMKMETAINKLIIENKKPTQKKVSELCGLSLRTVKKYWKDFDGLVKINTKRKKTVI